MSTSSGRIRPLPSEVAAQIHSSATINTLQDVILGLLRNSLDAGATRVEIFVDFSRGGCIVEDDGCGIPAEEFHEKGGLGKFYFTSKYGCPAQVHGQYGTFLASLSSLAIVTITSCRSLQEPSNSLVLHRARPIARLTPVSSDDDILFRERGTRVIVRDLFGDMPVRVKHRAALFEGQLSMEREIDSLKYRIIALLLAWAQPIAVVIRDRDNKVRFSSRSLVSKRRQSQLSGITTLSETYPALVQYLLYQASYIPTRSVDDWVPVSGSTSSVSVNGLMCLKPAPTRRVQFISLGISPVRGDLGYNVLYEEVNNLFAASSFGTSASDATGRRQKFARRSINKSPMFCLRIDFENVADSNNVFKQELFLNDQLLKIVLDLITALINGFLKAHGFRSNYDMPKVSPSMPVPLPDFDSTHDQETAIETKIHSTQGGNAGSESRAISRPSSATTEMYSGMAGRDQTILTGLSLGQLHNLNEFSHLSRIRKGEEGRRSQIRTDISSILRVEGSSPASTSSEALPLGQSSSEATPSSIDFCSSISVPDPAVSPDNPTLPPPSVRGESEDLLQDETFTWKNPGTGEVFQVNSRTGMIIFPKPWSSNLSLRHRASSEPFSRPTRCRSISSTKSEQGSPACSGHGSWLQSVYRRWQNPVFQPPELDVPKVAHENNDGSHLPAYSSHISDAFTPADNIKVSKAALQNAHVISQVDGKFILVKLKVRKGELNPTARAASGVKEVLVCIDQHAADERCRLEALLADLCASPEPLVSVPRSNLGYSPAVNVILLKEPLIFSVSANEEPLFRTAAKYLARWGILYDLYSSNKSRSRNPAKRQCLVSVTALPPIIAERCRLEPHLLLDILRGEVWKRATARQSETQAPTQQDARDSNGTWPDATAMTTPLEDGDKSKDDCKWLSQIGSCPQGILDLVTSRACRSAIMFNDKLSHKQCGLLVSRLATCAFPFQCAHGRPSMIPLVGITSPAESECLESSSGDINAEGAWKSGSELGFGFSGLVMSMDDTLMEKQHGVSPRKSTMSAFQDWMLM
ncbi:hypothetical protein L228DRAFT_259186 [Xylona heveae TC161]|uniref:MutL C-terminal dimerisation domain-containing protein n=1 Tax=Xylona heveae (strain CBS 132557 / TC161) TaxID=1328760 RepID=A0A165J6V6_XYLHT|nr:hypothetical protein L228DRAFT_259186 [Xylona heveae TC161]KZF25818.1 hypothetical protein L228DRAFT_259186 [Xylona heveae TC161]